MSEYLQEVYAFTPMQWVGVLGIALAFLGGCGTLIFWRQKPIQSKAAFVSLIGVALISISNFSHRL